MDNYILRYRKMYAEVTRSIASCDSVTCFPVPLFPQHQEKIVIINDSAGGIIENRVVL
jgi:hypothetical protein